MGDIIDYKEEYENLNKKFKQFIEESTEINNKFAEKLREFNKTLD